MSGIASASGALATSQSTSIVSAASRAGLTYQITAGVSALPLARAWAASTAYTSGQVVKANGRYYRCITSGTSASSGGPSGVTSDVTDGTAHWRGGATEFAGGLKITNSSATIPAFWGFESDISATTGDLIPAGGGVVEMSVLDPTLIYVITASSTAVLTVAGLS